MRQIIKIGLLISIGASATFALSEIDSALEAGRGSGRIEVAAFVPEPTTPPVITQGSGTR